MDYPYVSGEVNLTERQVEILAQVRLGKTDKEIAEIFELSIRTVNYHITRIIKRLKEHGVTTRHEAVDYAVNNGWFK